MSTDFPSLMACSKLVVLLACWLGQTFGLPLDVSRSERSPSSPSSLSSSSSSSSAAESLRQLGAPTDVCVTSALAQNVCLFCDATGMRSGRQCCTDPETYVSCRRLTSWYLESYQPLASGMNDQSAPSLAQKRADWSDDVIRPNAIPGSDSVIRQVVDLLQAKSSGADGAALQAVGSKRSAVWWSNPLPFRRSVRSTA